jgi:hypothetical protein
MSELGHIHTESIRGHARVERVVGTGVTREENPEVELLLTVSLPDREPYLATHKQVVSRHVMHNLEPGGRLSVRVDPADPSRLEIG